MTPNHKKPMHIKRNRLNPFSKKTRLGLAVKSYEAQNDKKSVTLPRPPWVSKTKAGDSIH